MKLWIFDLDGTLADTFPVFFRSMEKIFADNGKHASPEILHTALGSTMPEFFSEHLGKEKTPQALQQLRQLSIDLVGEVKAFPGIPECLDALQASGREIAVWTARDRDSTNLVLETSGLSRFATRVVTGNCVTRAKPDPEGAYKVLGHFQRKGDEAVMVGDHSHDVNAARSAGLLGVRASWNPYWPKERCGIANHQFFTVKDFFEWMQGRLK